MEDSVQQEGGVGGKTQLEDAPSVGSHYDITFDSSVSADGGGGPECDEPRMNGKKRWQV